MVFNILNYKEYLRYQDSMKDYFKHIYLSNGLLLCYPRIIDSIAIDRLNGIDVPTEGFITSAYKHISYNFHPYNKDEVFDKQIIKQMVEKIITERMIFFSKKINLINLNNKFIKQKL